MTAVRFLRLRVISMQDTRQYGSEVLLLSFAARLLALST